jgi:hypothetical protein
MKRILGLVMGLLIVAGCERGLPESVGRTQEIVMVASDSLRLAKPVSELLEVEYLTPQPEPQFLLRWIGPERLPGFLSFHTIFIIGGLDDLSIIQVLSLWADTNLLSQRLATDTFGLFRFQNLWAQDQTVFCFLAQRTGELPKGLEVYGPRIQDALSNRFLARLHKLTYERGDDQSIAQEITKEYGFSLDVPLGFGLDESHRADHFIYLYAHNPDRSIFIYWRDRECDLKARSVSSLIALRDSLTQRYYDGDYALSGMCQAKPARFQGLEAIKTFGVWQNEKSVIGGPFVSYIFNYQGRFYFIDGSLFAPGQKKLVNLFQLDAILQTFNPAAIDEALKG